MTTKTPSAWEIEKAMSAWQSARATLSGDTVPEPDDFDGLLLDTDGDIMSVLERVLRASIDAGDMAELAEARAKDIRFRAARFKARKDTLREAGMAIMQALGMKRHEADDLTASIGNPRVSVKIADETKIPGKYFTTIRTVDKTKLRADLDNKVVIPGASLEDGKPSFTIRTQ